jgi:kynurenine formamidase
MGDLGVEFVAEVGFVCRGILLNAAKYKGVDALLIPFELGSPGVVTADDIKGMMSAQGLSPIEEGDCVFLYTGHGDIWANSKWPTMSTEERAAARDAFNAGEPGFGVGACEYMASLKIILTGGDTSANDAQPVGDEEGYAVPCHTEMQTKRGIWNIENLDFSPLIEAGVYEFLFAWAPLKIVGATGSPGNPVVMW